MGNFDDRPSPVKIITKKVSLALWALEGKKEMPDWLCSKILKKKGLIDIVNVKVIALVSALNF